MNQILLIEPDKILSESYELSFKKHNYQIKIVRDAQSAIYAVDKKVPDLIILEIQLAIHSGIEFLYELRSYSEWQAIPVLILSVVSRSEFSDSEYILFKELNVFDYCDKSKVSIEDLINKVNRKLLKS